MNNLPNLSQSQDSEQEVVLHGYLGPRADLSKNLSFAPLIDPVYLNQIQIISVQSSSDKDSHGTHERLKSINANTPIALRGVFRLRPGKNRKQPASKMKGLDDFEILLRDVQSLNDFPADIVLTPDTEFPPDQRHLQIRTDKQISQALILRSMVARQCANVLQDYFGFTEIETPLLFKSTSEGAREFIVPTRRKGLAYALPQSPQQFKQTLMSSGFLKYYQFAKCFRDEDLRADRQPEFTQLDLEASFTRGEYIMNIVEHLICEVWKDTLSIALPDHFPRLTYEEAMSRYGSDKPDLRSSIQTFSKVDYLLPSDLISKITSLTKPTVEAMIVPLETTPQDAREFISSFLDSPNAKPFHDNPDGGPGVFIYDSSKPLQGLSAFGFEAMEAMESQFELKDGYLVILQARKNIPFTGGSTSLGNLRTAIQNAAIDRHYLEPYSWRVFRPLWVTHFPLFSPPDPSEPGQGGNADLASTHHPFTSPKSAEDVDLLLKEPTKAVGDHYDLVINGEEIGGGSRRIHHAQMQEFIFRDILKMDDERITEFSHLLEALRAGCPPHAGIALGFDRLVAMIHSSKIEKKVSLRDVIAFPKSGKGDDLMMKSPGTMSEEVLETYHLKLR